MERDQNAPDTRDFQDARQLMLETAIEMYLEDGHPLDHAIELAHKLLQSPIEFELPDLDEL